MIRPDIPDFKNPPINEVAISCSFQSLSRLTGPQVGTFWSESLRSSYPLIQEVAPIDLEEERFEQPKNRRVKLELTTRPRPRTWFIDPSSDSLVQVQNNFFARNWRKRSAAARYPRYEKLREAFADEFRKFETFTQKNDLGKIKVKQCEVLYVNEIRAKEGPWDTWDQADRILTGISGVWTSDPVLGSPEHVSLQTSFRIVENQHNVGRLRVYLEPRFLLKEQLPCYQLTLQARGAPIGEGLKGVLAFADLGRQWIVRAFAAMTTAEMHKTWERNDVRGT